MAAVLSATIDQLAVPGGLALAAIPVFVSVATGIPNSDYTFISTSKE